MKLNTRTDPRRGRARACPTARNGSTVADDLITSGLRRDRLAVLLKAYHRKLPNEAFKLLFELSVKTITDRKAALGLSGSGMRKDRFARTHALPALPLLDAEEREVIEAYWRDLRENYARTDRVAGMRRMIREHGSVLPSALIGEMFGVKAAAVVQHRRDLRCRQSAAEARKLHREVMEADKPPQIEGLSEKEQRKLIVAWRALRDEELEERKRQDDALRDLSNVVPTAVLGALFGIGPSAVTVRRRRLKLPTPDAHAVRRAFTEVLPESVHLNPAEMHQLSVLRAKYLRDTASRRAQRFKKRKAALIKRLQAKKKGLKFPPFPCTGCSRSWPRCPQFFTRSKWAADGMLMRCKVCEYDERHRPPQGRVVAPGRMLSTDERSQFIKIVRDNRDLIPSRLLCAAFDFNKNHLLRLRKEAGVEVSTAEAWYLYLRWMDADEMPQTEGLPNDLYVRLEQTWKDEKDRFERALHEDDGRMGLQEEEARKLLQLRNPPESAPCHGPLCRGRMWPKSSRIFRRHTRCDPEDRRCLACTNLEKRLETVAQRKEG